MRRRRALLALSAALALGATVPSCGFDWDRYDRRLGEQCTAGQAGCTCEPGSFTECYDGPEATRDVGACRAGTHECNAAGDGYEECRGEITPGIEDCATPADDNCDGQVNEFCATFSVAYGDGDAYGVAVDGDDATILVGATGTGALALGGDPLDTSSAAGPQAFGAKLDGSLAHAWSHTWGGPDEQIARAVAADPDGDAFVAGSFRTSILFGGTLLTADDPEPDAFAARIGKDGTVVWAKRFGGQGLQEATSVVLGASGDVVLAGSFVGAVDFGDGDLTSAGARDVFLVKLAPDGSHVWSERFGDAGDQRGEHLAGDAANNAVVLAGAFDGALDFGAGAELAAADTDAYVARFDGTGQALASRSWPSPGEQVATAVAVDSVGFVYVGGTFEGSIDLGDGEVASKGKRDIFLVKLEPSLEPLWAHTFGDVEDDVLHDIVTDEEGDAVLVATFRGSIDFGGGALAATGGDIALVELDPQGNHLVSRRFGNVSTQGQRYALAIDKQRRILLAGRFAGAIDFGAGVITPPSGDESLFLARFPP